VHYDRIRTYEVVAQSQPSKEVLLTLRGEEKDGGGSDTPDRIAKKRRGGAYFKEIGMRTLLRKTRAKRWGEEEARSDNWDKTRIGYRLPDHDEQEMRKAAAAQITDPLWISEQMRALRGENMAEGQGEAIDDEEPPDDEGAAQLELEVHHDEEDVDVDEDN